MSNHQRLTNEEFQSRLCNLTDTLYEEFVVPNPYRGHTMVSFREYRQFVETLIETYFDFALPSNLVHAPQVQAAIVNRVPTPVAPPAPVAPIVTPAPRLRPNFENAVRCASNTLTTGERCARAAFRPYTLCAVHFRYFKVHNRLPPGGAVCPGRPHPTDVWPAHRPPMV